MNLIGANLIGKLVTIGVTLLLIPIILTGTLGWAFFDSAQFTANWNVTGNKSDFHAFISAVVLCIWAFVGVESASVNAGLVKNPKRTIPLSTLIGTFIAAVVYILSTTAMMGMYPANTLAASGAPFSDAMTKISGAPIAASIVSIITALACFTSLGSWMMLTAEAGARTSNDGYFPKIYGNRNASGTPVKGLIIEAIQMSTLMIILMILQMGNEGNSADLFGKIASIAVLTVLLPYLYSCLNLIARTELKLDQIFPFMAAIIAAIFCLVALYGAKGEGLAEAIIVTLVILIFYCRWENEHQEKGLNIPKPAPTSVPNKNTNDVEL
jgi:cadaverine:lysine antiporter